MPKSECTITVELTLYEIEAVLTSLGRYQHYLQDQQQNSQPIEWIIDKIYRKMGVK